MAIQDLLNEVEELGATVSSMTLTSATEPHQQEWEDEWESLGYDLPITVGTELYWNDGTQLRGMYMAVPDGFTLVVRWSKILDTFEDIVTADIIPAVRNIWVRWWFDDTHMIGTGIYDGVEGTYKIFMDGTVELITTDIAFTVHSVAGYMVVKGIAPDNAIYLYNLNTDTKSLVANVLLPAEIYGPIYAPATETEPANAGWGFTERVVWADETDPANLDLYYGDGNQVHFYEHGVGESTLFFIPVIDNFSIATMCFQNDLLAISYRISGGGIGELSIYLATIFDLTGTVIFELGISGEDISEDPDAWGTDLYRAWHFRKTEGSTTLIDVLKPKPPIRYGRDERYDALPSGQMENYGTHTWEIYLRYDTANNRYITDTVYDLRLNTIQNLGNEQVVVPSDTTTQSDVVISDRHRWAASLISNRKQCYTFIRTSPSGANLLLGWGEAFGIKSKAQDKLTQGDVLYGGQELPVDRPVLESGRHGAVVLALNSENSTGRVYHITDYVEPSPTEMVIYSAELAEDSSIITVDLTDIIATLDEEYELLKVQLDIVGSVVEFMSIQINDLANSDHESSAFWSNGTTVGNYDTGASGFIELPVGVSTGSYLLTFPDFRSADNYLTMYVEGGYWDVGGATTIQLNAAGFVDHLDAKPLTKLIFTRAAGTFEAGNRVVVTVLRTRGKYSNGGQNDYRMA